MLLTAAFLLVSSATDATASPDFWMWLSRTLTVEGTLNIAGLVLLVVLFSRDLILTKGQHERRIADKEKSHQEAMAAKDDRIRDLEAAKVAALAAADVRYNDMVAEKDSRYGEMRDSRDYYRSARLAEQTEKEELIGQLVDANRGLQVAARALGALEQAVPSEGT